MTESHLGTDKVVRSALGVAGSDLVSGYYTFMRSYTMANH
jgi:hypothetical protein